MLFPSVTYIRPICPCCPTDEIDHATDRMDCTQHLAIGSETDQARQLLLLRAMVGATVLYASLGKKKATETSAISAPFSLLRTWLSSAEHS